MATVGFKGLTYTYTDSLNVHQVKMIQTKTSINVHMNSATK